MSKATRQKRTKPIDGIVEAVRATGVSCNRTSLHEAAVAEFIKKRTTPKGEPDVKAIAEAMKTYYATNPVKAQRRIEKMKAKLAAVMDEAKALGLKV